MSQRSERLSHSMASLRFSVFVIATIVISLLAPVGTTLAVPTTDRAFTRVWERTDKPVADQAVSRTWMWGPEAIDDAQLERYAGTLNGFRKVQYFDKTRMEINDPEGDPSSAWYVTNGLLAQELITGNMQVGDDKFEHYEPAQVNVAGDPGVESPTYATMNLLMERSAAPVGSLLSEKIDARGSVSQSSTYDSHRVTAEYYVAESRHSVASVFWAFMNSSGTVSLNGSLFYDQLFQSPFYATGFPLTEAYWMNVMVGGVPTDVLVQVFQRRILTYTPGNAIGWQVEAGNVGLHYYEWRYFDILDLPCGTIDQPSYVPRSWLYPEQGLLAAMSRIGMSFAFDDPRRLALLDRANGIQAAYHLALAETRCFRSDMYLYDAWLEFAAHSFIAGDPNWGPLMRRVQSQVRIAIEDPTSPLGLKIRQIEHGGDSLRTMHGPWAYWYYLLVPISDFLMTPDQRLGTYAIFRDYVNQYNNEIGFGDASYGSFADFLRVKGYINMWVPES